MLLNENVVNVKNTSIMKYPILIKITYTQICNISRCSMYSSSYDETSSDRSERLFKKKKKIKYGGDYPSVVVWMDEELNESFSRL